ncbi:hypothetical protein [Olivibacter jilunii]|uniref:hypothetical protein n=1 Tax=Olivibacter jilunii TaxID=985016 RepID=UPI001030186C|nr:hypothetical protein [Olivibacter jilunii]
MNLNNLEDRKEDAKSLGFSEKTIAQIEENMRLGVPQFKAYDSMPATGKGQIDYTLNFKKSAQSDYYYWNSFQAVHNKVDPLEPGQKYMVITKGEDGKNMVKKLDNVNEAIDLFKKQNGNAELSIGKDPAHKNMVANMENGKVNFVAKTFQAAYYANPTPQTFYIEEGRGFNKEQAGNMVQKRAVFRDDLLNSNGIIYQAWLMLNTDKPRDRNGNYELKTYHVPNYGFDLKESLDKYNIKGLEDPEKAEKVYASIKNGNRVLVTAERKDGETLSVFVEAAVRWGKINFTLENGKPEKREEFLKPEIQKNVSQSGQTVRQTVENNQNEGVALGR